MKIKTCCRGSLGKQSAGLTLALGLPAALAISLIAAPGGSRGGGGAPRAAVARPAPVSRASHGSVRHAETHVIQRPAEVRREPVHPAESRREPGFAGGGGGFRGGGFRGGGGSGGVARHDWGDGVLGHHYWHDFAFGRRCGVLPVGFLTLAIGGVPYCYYGGIYYQPVDGGYQEVYPPVGADIPQPPDGAIPIEAGGVTYYYAGGAFYLQQPDGSFATAPPPMGVVVPELPPGAVQVAAGGGVAYQFNGIYYQPVFVDGVTQYQTFMP